MGQTDPMDPIEIGRAILAGIVVRRVADTRRIVVLAAAVVAVLGLIVVVLAGGWWRALGVIVLLAGVAVVVGAWLLGVVATRLVRRFVSPDTRDLPDVRAAVDEAIEDLDVPTGPVSALRMAWRLRRGVDDEVRRVVGVGEELARRFG